MTSGRVTTRPWSRFGSGASTMLASERSETGASREHRSTPTGMGNREQLLPQPHRRRQPSGAPDLRHGGSKRNSQHRDSGPGRAGEPGTHAEAARAAAQGQGVMGRSNLGHQATDGQRSQPSRQSQDPGRARARWEADEALAGGAKWLRFSASWLVSLSVCSSLGGWVDLHPRRPRGQGAVVRGAW